MLKIDGQGVDIMGRFFFSLFLHFFFFALQCISSVIKKSNFC